MQKQFCKILLFLSVTGAALSIAKAAGPMTPGLSHKYGIYFFSEEGTEMDSLYGSYLSFKLKAGVGAVYDYFIKDGQQVTGRIERYEENEEEKKYELEGFFGDRKNAVLRIMDMPNCDNLKVAVIHYANEKEDTTGIFWQYILTDDDYTPFINKR